jgi:membrane protease YdiL (CAAX protease family)
MLQTAHRYVRRHPIISFFVIAFCFSWGYDGAVSILVDPAPGILIRGVVRTWGPLIAAGVETVAINGNLRSWAGQVTKWRVKPRWYLFAVGIPLLWEDGLATSAVHLAGGGPVAVLPSPWWHYVANFLVVLLLAGSLEEFGWRGFAQPRLQERYSALTASVVIGVLWALWHLPLFYLHDVSAYDPSGYWTSYLPHLVFQSVVLAWLYNGTGGSLLFPMVAHATGNMPQVVSLVGEVGLAAQYTSELIGLGLLVSLVIIYGRSYLAPRTPTPRIAGRNQSSNHHTDVD